MIKLSNRMMAIAHMVDPCDVIVDVGTDHGFLPIYLVEKRHYHIMQKR